MPAGCSEFHSGQKCNCKFPTNLKFELAKLPDRQTGRRRDRMGDGEMETQADANWQPERLACLVSFVSVVQRPLEGHLFGLRSNAASACSPSRRTHTHTDTSRLWESVRESGQLKCFKVLHGQHINKCLHIYFVPPPLDFPCIPHPPSHSLVAFGFASIRCASCSQHVHNSTLSMSRSMSMPGRVAIRFIYL